MSAREAMSPTSRLKVDDSISVTTKQGSHLNLKVTELREDRIVGGSQQVLAADIERVEKKQFSPAKTTVIAALVIGVALSPPLGVVVALSALFM